MVRRAGAPLVAAAYGAGKQRAGDRNARAYRRLGKHLPFNDGENSLLLKDLTAR